MIARIAENMIDRVSGPLRFRLLLQPVMAVFLAIKGGLGDARSGKPPYFWALIWDPTHRLDMLREGWQSVGRVFALALALDVIYQLIVLGFVFPGEAIIVAFLLAIVPYLVLRGLVTRIARRSWSDASRRR